MSPEEWLAQQQQAEQQPAQPAPMSPEEWLAQQQQTEQEPLYMVEGGVQIPIDQPLPEPEPEKEFGIGESIVGAGETALTMATGATSGLAGMIGGTLSQLAQEIADGKYGTQEAAKRIQQEAMRLSGELTYAPRTEAGQEFVQEIGEATAPLQAVGGLTSQLQTMGAATRAAQPAISATVRKAAQAPGEAVQAARQVVKQVPGEVLPSGRVKPTVDVPKIEQVLRADPENVKAAPYRLVAGKAVKDAMAEKALKQGFDPGVIAPLKAASKKDKFQSLQMLEVHKRGRESKLYAMDNRPIDVIGESIQERVKYVFDQKKKAGQALEAEVKKLAGVQVDTSATISKFMDDLREMGVKLKETPKGLKVITQGSIIEGHPKSGALLQRVVNRFYATDVPDAKRVHEAKRYLDTQINIGKISKDGLAAEAERVVKGLRHNLNEDLRELSPEYKAQNIRYSESLQALSELQDLVGSKIDLNAPNIDRALGGLSRRITSNYTSGSRVELALKQLNSTASKYGAPADGDIKTQLMVANELDRMFGSPAATGFKEQIRQAGETGVERALRTGAEGTVTETAIGAVGKAARKIKGINEENAINAFEELLKRELSSKGNK